MEMKKEEQKSQLPGFIVEALIMRIEALIHLIKSDVIRSSISAKLGEIKDIKALYQLLSLAQTSIENSELIENKIKGGLVFNPFTGELISELDYHYAMEDMIEMMKGVVNNPAPKMNPKPPTV